MALNHQNLDSFTSSTDGFGDDSDPEVELAYVLQNVQPGDQRITIVLVERYAADMHQFIQAVLETFCNQESTEDTIQTIILRTFVTAVNEVDRFWGEQSVYNWLISITLDQIKKTLPRFSFLNSKISLITSSRLSKPRITTSIIDVDDEYQQVFLQLPKRARLYFILRYLLQLSAKDIAQVLDSDPQKITKQLSKYRHALLELNQVAQKPHIHQHRKLIQQIDFAHDGLMPHHPDAEAELIEHAENCSICQTYLSQLDDMGKTISALCTSYWPLTQPNSGEIKFLAEKINANLSQPSRFIGFEQAIWKGTWIGIVLIVIAAFGFLVFKSTIEEDIEILTPTTTPSELPEPINIQSYSISTQTPRIVETDTFVSIQPAASGNGRWIAFTVSSLSDREVPLTNSADIYIYDRNNRSLERLRFNNSGVEFFTWAYAPWTEISQESTQALETNDQEIQTMNIPQHSSGIFFYDRDNDQRIRIDLALNGQPSDVDNFSPVVSSNGRFLAFWTNASELFPEDSSTCADVSPRRNCLDVVTMDRRSGDMQRVPVGREINQLGKNAYLSVSDDGNLLALSITLTDNINAQLKIPNPSEVFIYDFNARYYIPINLSYNHTNGDGPSLIPKLSSDGRYVVFASLAENLDLKDDNQEADIFIRDLDTGTTELLSLTDQDFEFIGNSSPSDRYYGFWMDNISISSNGRYIAVSSTLENLTNHYRLGCSPSPEGYCLSIFVHDRVTEDTIHINNYQLEDHDRIIDISDDGQILTNFEHFAYCPTITQAQVCAELWQQDRNEPSNNLQRYGYYASHYSRWIHDTFFDGQEGAANAISISPDKKILAVGTKEDTIHLWRIPDRERFASFSSNSISSIYSLDFSLDGEYLAAGSSNGSVHLWEVSSGNEVYRLNDHPGRVIRLRFTPLGDHLVVGTSQQIWVWKEQDQSFIRSAVLDYPGNFINDYDLSPDGKWLAIAGEDKTTWIQNFQSQQVTLRLGGHEQEVTDVEFSPDGKYLASGDTLGIINIWQLDWIDNQTLNAKYQRTLVQPDWVTNLSYSEDGSILASSSFSGRLRLWRLPGGELLESPPTGRFDFMPNGIFYFDGRILVAGSSSGLIHVWSSPENISKPRFFFRSESEHLGFIPVSSVDPTGESNNLEPSQLDMQQLFIEIYEAAGAVIFEVQVPIYLPPRLIFTGARVEPGGIIVLQYEILDSFNLRTIAQIFISQHTELPAFLIGPNATVERSKVEGRDAEYVEGDWVPYSDHKDSKSNSEDSILWRWNPDYPAKRLRWKEGNVIFAIHYKSFDDTDNGSLLVIRDDLITIAESMAVLSQTSESETLYINHIVHPGDTCESIAEQYGITVNRLINLNALTETCDSIFNGQELIIPLTNTRIPSG